MKALALDERYEDDLTGDLQLHAEINASSGGVSCWIGSDYFEIERNENYPDFELLSRLKEAIQDHTNIFGQIDSRIPDAIDRFCKELRDEVNKYTPVDMSQYDE